MRYIPRHFRATWLTSAVLLAGSALISGCGAADRAEPRGDAATAESSPPQRPTPANQPTDLTHTSLPADPTPASEPADSTPARGSHAENSKTTEDTMPESEKAADPQDAPLENAPHKTELATLGGGCFWCTEAVFQKLKGVEKVVSGYSGGDAATANYQAVCSGQTKHAEVIQVTFDPAKITYDELLEVFWRTHDPTTPNQQGADRGPQYRSVVFYHDDRQRDIALRYKKQLDDSGAFAAPIVTEISPFTEFFGGEKYHQNYYQDNPNQGYCRVVIAPKLQKFQKDFADKIRE